VTLFSSKTIANALAAFNYVPTQTAVASAREWAHRAGEPNMDLQNESQLEQEFNRLIVQDVLGYRPTTPTAVGTMRVKHTVPGGTIVDVALGHFSDNESTVLAPLELKGPKVALDRIMPGRAKTPVEQAWGYANDAPGAKWVLLSNMRELRLYAVGHGRLDYESFDLKRIGDPQELKRLMLLLHADQLLGGAVAELLQRSAQADRDITDTLYKDYKAIRDNLLQFVGDQRSDIDADARIDLVQTLLDRLLFITFAEDSFLLPENSLKDAIESYDKYKPQPKWNQLKTLFEWVNVGATEHNIPPYNGGLFATKPLLDSIEFPDFLVEQFAKLAAYDFRSEVSVTILGHIFEQSISDIEALHAEAKADTAPKTGKRKRDGVVYTPDFVTRFIVERTIGLHLEESASALMDQYGKVQPDGEIKWKGGKAGERDYWTAYLARMTSLRIVDPACGSGAFLIAAFDYLHSHQKRVRERLAELDPGLLVHLQENADVEIITNNLFGVDVNAESVEITKLALWLKTAKRNRKLESLEANIQCGNSLISDELPGQKSFDWHIGFSRIFDGSDDEGFDIVLGNPPYVRMELLKDIKPWLEAHYAVASDRADLYAYFFELGVRLLAPGGRLGYISSSTFFRTGSGAPLRAYLAQKAQVESVVDFGDLQVFDGVTTYPAIVTLRKGGQDDGTLTYLNARALPDNLNRVFDQQSMTMPRDRLGSGTWRFESDLLDNIRAKMAAGRKTLAETYGAPLRGIITGFNDAFILKRVQRDILVKRDPRSVDLLKPFLIGENLKRWHVESDDLWLIYTPKNQIDIDDYPAIRDHLLPWRDRLKARAGSQGWWELQQAQVAYLDSFQGPKTLYNRFTNRPQFSFKAEEIFTNDAPYFVPTNDEFLATYLNSRLAWFILSSYATRLQNGYYQLLGRHVEPTPIPEVSKSEREAIVHLGKTCQANASSLHKLLQSGVNRLKDVSQDVTDVRAIWGWPSLTFADLQALLQKRCKATIPVAERDQWESWFNDRKAEAAKLTANIKAAEAAIDERVYRLFDLTPTEIAAVEDALALASPGLSLKAYEAISAVEGLHLSDEARARLTADGSISERRERVSRAHAA
jgi:type I restriction-modification system DNA methylase subunit